MKTLDLDEKGLQRLKLKYEDALENNELMFTFEGSELLTSYAKYLIEYAEMKFKDKSTKVNPYLYNNLPPSFVEED